MSEYDDNEEDSYDGPPPGWLDEQYPKQIAHDLFHELMQFAEADCPVTFHCEPDLGRRHEYVDGELNPEYAEPDGWHVDGFFMWVYEAKIEMYGGPDDGSVVREGWCTNLSKFFAATLWKSIEFSCLVDCVAEDGIPHLAFTCEYKGYNFCVYLLAATHPEAKLAGTMDESLVYYPKDQDEESEDDDE